MMGTVDDRLNTAKDVVVTAKCSAFDGCTETLRQQLATMTAAYANAVEQHNKTLDELAECERERDELKTWLEDQVCEAKDFAYKLEGKTVELATVTKERDELVEAVLAVCCDPEGRVVIRGSDGDRAVLQAALAKLDAYKTGEGS